MEAGLGVEPSDSPLGEPNGFAARGEPGPLARPKSADGRPGQSEEPGFSRATAMAHAFAGTLIPVWQPTQTHTFAVGRS